MTARHYGFAIGVLACMLVAPELAGCSRIGEMQPSVSPSPVQTSTPSPGVNGDPADHPVPLAPHPTPDGSFDLADLGPQDGAMGPSALNDQGSPVSYTVIENDKLGAMADRFGIDVSELISSDGVRYDYTDTFIEPGDQIGFEVWTSN